MTGQFQWTSGAEGAARSRRQLDRVLRALLLAMFSHRELDQAIDQFSVRNSRSFPQFRIHADGSEAGDGVDLVEVDAPAGLFQKEIDARHAPAFQATERTDSVLLKAPHLHFRKLCRNVEPRAFFQ